MKTVNSLSGGRTSSYLAVHYPADVEIFAVVCNKDPKCAHKDKAVNSYAREKLQRYSAYKDFIGTPEDPKTLEIVMNLEQKIGREIIWVRGESFEDVVKGRKAVPNQMKRFCTSEMKLKPIFWFCKTFLDPMVKMRCGFRIDEFERAERFTTDYKYAYKGEYYESGVKRHRWKTEKWREGEFPLIDDYIDNRDVLKYWSKFPQFDFPNDSNCQMCFWKNIQQLRKNFDENPAQMQWAKRLEKKEGRTFKKTSLEITEKIGLELGFNFGGGSGCQAGFCTD
jgi:hypothetical protein